MSTPTDPTFEPRLIAAEADIVTLQTDTSALTASATTNVDRLVSLEASNTDLTARLAAAESAIADLKNQVSTLQATDADVKDRLTALEAAAGITPPPTPIVP